MRYREIKNRKTGFGCVDTPILRIGIYYNKNLFVAQLSFGAKI